MSGQGRDRFLLAKSTSHAVVEGREVIVFGVGDGPGHLVQDGSQVGVAFGRLATEPLASALLVSRTDPGPGGDMFVGSKARHIRANCKIRVGNKQGYGLKSGINDVSSTVRKYLWRQRGCSDTWNEQPFTT